jgi:hypothetical protein
MRITYFIVPSTMFDMYVISDSEQRQAPLSSCHNLINFNWNDPWYATPILSDPAEL